MKIRKIQFEDFIIQNNNIEFEINEKGTLITGPNGCGKSLFIEFLVSLFGNDCGIEFMPFTSATIVLENGENFIIKTKKINECKKNLIPLKLNKISYVNEYSVPTFITQKKLKEIPNEVLTKYINKEISHNQGGISEFIAKSGETSHNQGGISEFIAKSGETFSFSELSYGERKIIFILSAIYSEKSEIILLDLPENGLSLTIQSKIINEITNKDIQLIVATHAPYIYDDSISNGLFLNELKM